MRRSPASLQAERVIDEPWFYAAAVLIAGISKGGFGGGVGLIGVPLMALVIAPVQAAGIMLPILCMMDLFGVRMYRGQWDPRNLHILLPAALLGIAIGTATFRWLGFVLHRRVSDKLFYQLCYGLLAATGAKLLYDGLAGALG
jgi:uncharacterized membrane protein YfcA